jgi:sugar phosphate isomerase/epimerase
MPLTRREILAAAGMWQAEPPALQSAPQLCIFSKHLPKLNYDELGKTSRQLGFDGVDLTMRPQGHVLPERAAEDLPRAVEAIRSHGLAVPMITTELLSFAHPTARPILSTAARLKVPYYKPGYWRYGNRDVNQVLAGVKRDVEGLLELGKQYGIEAGFHNHSADYVGMALWDIREIIRDLDPRWIGYYFDPAHATVEGGLAGWQVSLRFALPRLKMVALKDFYWEKQKGRWQAKWCPMGEGMVNWPRVFSAFAGARFSGPISLHVEYESADEMAAIARDLEFIKKQVKAAYGT